MMVDDVDVVLLDIEGTTTSIKFVQESLFPYARDHISKFLQETWESDATVQDIKAVKKQVLDDSENTEDSIPSKKAKLDSIEPPSPGKVGNGADAYLEHSDAKAEGKPTSRLDEIAWLTGVLHGWMDGDRKVTALKQLQGRIWEQGYKDGSVKGHLYADVNEALQRLVTEEHKKVCIYSSGSVEAQKLLFKYSEFGDLSEFITGNFDTKLGAKTEATSYQLIAKELGCDPSKVLFLTDVEREAIPSIKAGMQCCLVVRPGNAPLSTTVDGCRVITSLDALFKDNDEK